MERELADERELLAREIAALRSRLDAGGRPRGFVAGFVVGTLFIIVTSIGLLAMFFGAVAHVE